MKHTNCALLETLEERRLFSGNVTVAYNAPTDTILVVGDIKPNEIQISQPGTGKKYVIAGLNGTTVNGAAAWTVPAGPGGYSGFSVGLGAGNDSVIFDGGICEDVQISMLGGNDRVR